MTPLVETSPHIVRVPVTADAAALELATRAWPAAERKGQLAGLADLVRAGQANDFFLLVLRKAGELKGASLAQLVSGQAAVIWLPQVATGTDADCALALLAAVHVQLARSGALLAQSLLDCAAPAGLLEAAGYTAAGTLLYMVAELKPAPSERPGELASNARLDTYAPANHGRFASTIERTYCGSLDCPAVDGLRPVESVLAGYRAVGQFRPELWSLLRDDAGRDIGCLLLADHPRQDQMEIVYLGIVPEARGRSLGKTLVQVALERARQAGRQRVVLAVDSANEPAVAAYRSVGFVAWHERALWIKRLEAAANES